MPEQVRGGWELEALAAQDVAFLLGFVPTWANEPVPEGMAPMFYGTLTAAGDRQVVARVDEIRARLAAYRAAAALNETPPVSKED